jgi:hypothetical protein
VQNKLFEAALGIGRPWYVQGVDFDVDRKVLTIASFENRVGCAVTVWPA